MSRRRAASDVFAAISDPNRRRILALLAQGERSVKDLLRSFRMTQPGLSQHLGVLRAAGLVTRRASGRERLYGIRARRLKTVADWVGQYERFWRSRMNALGDYLKGRE